MLAGVEGLARISAETYTANGPWHRPRPVGPRLTLTGSGSTGRRTAQINKNTCHLGTHSCRQALGDRSRMRVFLWRPLRAMCNLVRGFVHTIRLYHDVHQLLLGVDVAFHAFPRQFAQRQEGKWPQEFQSLASGLHVSVHLSPGYIHHLLLRIDERLRGLARQATESFIDAQ